MKVSVNHPHLPKGEPVAILGNLIAVPNGESAEVDDETAALFKEQNEITVEKALSTSEIVTVSTSSNKGGEK
jgi:hypothetical protein